MISGELFQLVKGLSAPEVRYFRKYAKRHSASGNKYLLLFDAMLSMDNFDEAALRRQLQDEPLLNQLPAARNYLGKMLLRALREYQFNSSLGRRLRAQLDELETLYSRGLFRAAQRTASKGLHCAQAGGEPLLALQFLQWQRRLNRRDPGAVPLEQVEDETLEQIQGETRLIQVYDQVFRLARKRLLGTSSARELPALPLEPPGSFNGQIAYHTTQAILAQFRHQPEQAHLAFASNLETWHRFPTQIEDHPARYTSALSNYLASCHMLRKYDDFSRFIAQIQPDFVPKAHWPRIKAIFLNYQLLFAANMEQWEAVESLEAEIQNWLEQFKIPPTQDLNLRYNLWVTHFVRNNLDQAWFWLRSILHRPRETERQDIQDLARLLELVHLYEKGEEDVLEYRLRSVKRFLRSRPDLPDWYAHLTQFLHAKIPFSKTKAQTQLKSQLEANAEDLGQQALIWWISKH